MAPRPKPPIAGFTLRDIRGRAHELHCDPMTYRKELEHPGSVLGGVGTLIRRDIAEQRAAGRVTASIAPTRRSGGKR